MKALGITNEGLIVSLILLSRLTSGDYLGKLCGTQWGIDHYYPDGGSKVQDCINHCHGEGYKVAGLIFGFECFCDNELNYPVCRPNDQRPICTTGNCSSAGMQCNSDDTMICGDTIWYSVYDADDNYNVITHWDTLVNYACSALSPSCDWICYVSDALYEFATGQVIGTVDYDIQSSYCMSAVHDLRYFPNEKTEVIIARKSGSETVEGSWRYGIQSTWKNTSYEFNVQIPSQRYEFDSSTLWGFANMGSKTFDCVRYGSSANQPFAATLGNVAQTEATNVPLSDSTLFYCGLNKTANRLPATYVPVVVELHGHGREVTNRTVTIKVGDDLNLSFQTGSLDNGPWSVVKAGKILVTPSTDSTITVLRKNVQIPNQGFYDLLDNNGNWQLSIRVIVVAADVDLHQCGEFRGVPREDNTCLCFPPFGNADDCSQLCNPSKLDGTFGPNCDMNCGKDQNCKGLLICGEDPFGCHCASGWTGDVCTEPCPQGTYGPECKSHASGCHCLGGAPGCSVITGLCPLGCIWGWFEDSCTQQGGYLNTLPFIINITYSTITVGWKAWVINVDGGDITPDGYYLNRKKCVDDENHWENISTLFPEGRTSYSHLNYDLDSFTCYDFRIQTEVNGIVMPRPSPVVNGTTVCGTPTKAPYGLTGSAGTREITVAWNWPSKSSWNCASTEIHCNYTSTYDCGTQSHIGSFEKTAPSSGGSDSYPVLVPDFSTTDFTCYLVNLGQRGPTASLDNQKPQTATPPQVTNFVAYNTAEGLLGTWTAPTGDDGYISDYNIKVDPQKSGTGPTVDIKITQTRYLYNTAYTGEDYKFTITAWNNEGAGVPFEKTVEYSLPSV